MCPDDPGLLAALAAGHPFGDLVEDLFTHDCLVRAAHQGRDPELLALNPGLRRRAPVVRLAKEPADLMIDAMLMWGLTRGFTPVVEGQLSDGALW